MVDVSAKPVSHRVAIASGRVLMKPATASRIRKGTVGKGDVIAVARIAGIQSIKRAAELIPLCHPLQVTSVDIEFEIRTRAQAMVTIEARVEAFDRTGVEMEALTAVSVAALTIYDMCKSYDRSMTISNIRLDEKSGGKSGEFKRE